MYNLASGVETSILELADMINELTGNPTPAQVLPERDWDHSGRRFGSTVKATARLGFRAQISLREGLVRTIEWTRQNLPLIESCIRKHDEEMWKWRSAPPPSGRLNLRGR